MDHRVLLLLPQQQIDNANSAYFVSAFVNQQHQRQQRSFSLLLRPSTATSGTNKRLASVTTPVTTVNNRSSSGHRLLSQDRIFGRMKSSSSTITTTTSRSAASTTTTNTATSTSTSSSSSTSTNNNNNNNNNKNYKGEADIALERGLRFDKTGQPRLANASFLEAATLLQCFLEMPEYFGHVTNLGSRRTTTSVNNSNNPDSIDNDGGTIVDDDGNDDVRAVLAYTLIRLAFNSLDALSDPKAACRLYEMAVLADSKNPSATSFAGLGTAIEASATRSPISVLSSISSVSSTSSSTPTQEVDTSDDNDDTDTNNTDDDLVFLQNAIVAYREALRISNTQQPLTRLSLAVALERLGGEDNVRESESILDDMSRNYEASVSCMVDSWGYVRWHSRRTSQPVPCFHLGTRDMIAIAINAAMPLILQQRSNPSHGLVCEFGVGNGRSLRMTQELLPLDIQLHGFDTFTGLPVAWNNEPAGSYSTGGMIPQMEPSDNVHFHRGLFKDTLPPFLESLSSSESESQSNDDQGPFVAYANIDCDLYTSTLDILESLHGKIRPGTILVFDEYIMHPTWRQDEFRAWRECGKRFGWTYEYLAFSLSTKQAVVKVTQV